MRNLVDIITKRADEITPGDMFDTRCGTGYDAFRKVVSVRFEDNDRPGSPDRVELTFESNGCMGSTRMLRDCSVVRVAVFA